VASEIPAKRGGGHLYTDEEFGFEEEHEDDHDQDAGWHQRKVGFAFPVTPSVS